MPEDHYHWLEDTLIFDIYLQPRASRNAIIGLHNSAVKISLTSPPIEGAANKQLIQFLAKQFQVKKTDISLLSGKHSRHKRISVSNPSHFLGFFPK